MPFERNVVGENQVVGNDTNPLLQDFQNDFQFADTNGSDALNDAIGVYQYTLSSNDFLEELENDLRGRVWNPATRQYQVIEDQRLMSDRSTRMFMAWVKQYFKHHHLLGNITAKHAERRVIAFSKTMVMWFLQNKDRIAESDFNNRTQIKRAVEDLYDSHMSRPVGARENTNVYGHESLQRVEHRYNEQRKLSSPGMGRFFRGNE